MTALFAVGFGTVIGMTFAWKQLPGGLCGVVFFGGVVLLAKSQGISGKEWEEAAVYGAAAAVVLGFILKRTSR